MDMECLYTIIRLDECLHFLDASDVYTPHKFRGLGFIFFVADGFNDRVEQFGTHCVNGSGERGVVEVERKDLDDFVELRQVELVSDMVDQIGNN
jgi:hypothetical protein